MKLNSYARYFDTPPCSYLNFLLTIVFLCIIHIAFIFICIYWCMLHRHSFMYTHTHSLPTNTFINMPLNARIAKARPFPVCTLTRSINESKIWLKFQVLSWERVANKYATATRRSLNRESGNTLKQLSWLLNFSSSHRIVWASLSLPLPPSISSGCHVNISYSNSTDNKAGEKFCQPTW